MYCKEKEARFSKAGPVCPLRTAFSGGEAWCQAADCERLRQPHPGGSPHQHLDMGGIPAQWESWCGLAHIAHHATRTKPLTQAENTIKRSGLCICVKGGRAVGHRRQ